MFTVMLTLTKRHYMIIFQMYRWQCQVICKHVELLQLQENYEKQPKQNPFLAIPGFQEVEPKRGGCLSPKL